MPRRKKLTPDMTDLEAWEALFPKRIRKRIERESDLEIEPEAPENPEESENDSAINEEDR